MTTLRNLFVLTGVSAAIALSACERKAPQPSQPTKPADQHADHDHDHDHDHDDKPAAGGATGGHMHADGHHHGPTTELGEVMFEDEGGNAWTVRASRDGDVTPGGDIPIDVWITPTQGNAAKVTAVRFWVGIKSGRGSMKVKAELEKDNWHTHADVPSPIPADSRLWIEFETDTGESVVLDFDLKA